MSEQQTTPPITAPEQGVKRRESPLCEKDGEKLKNYGFYLGIGVLAIGLILAFTALPVNVNDDRIVDGMMLLRNWLVLIAFIVVSALLMFLNETIAKKYCKI